MRVWLLLLCAGCTFQHGSLTDAAGGDDDAASDADTDAKLDGAAGCPMGFTTLTNAPSTSKYKAFAAKTFPMAVDACKALGTHLVHLDTQGEVDAIYALIDQVTTGAGDTHLYRVVGARNKAVIPNTWLDLDGNQLTFLPWGVGEPTAGINEDCILVRPENTPINPPTVIGADQCLTNHEYACECE